MSEYPPYGSEQPGQQPPNQQPGGYPPPPAYGQQPQYGQPSYGAQPAFGQPSYGAAPSGPRPNNNLVLAILSTVLCCLPAGIVSIVYAAKVNGLWDSGQYAQAQAAAESAKKWAIISAGVTLVGVVLYVIFIVILGASGSFSP